MGMLLSLSLQREGGCVSYNGHTRSGFAPVIDAKLLSFFL